MGSHQRPKREPRSKVVESEAVELIGSKPVESQAVESEAVEPIGGKADELEADESDTDVSLFDESDTDESDTEKLIGRECEYCLKVGVHFTQTCPYKYHVPKNAIVSRRCVVVCNFCGCLFRDSCCGSCGLSDGCAVLMDCLHCGKIGEHLTFTCPSREGKPSYFSCDPYTGSCSFH
ncbi:uncharacterized protein LOC110753416 isoform X2 [Prunus avium]|uniref:Uncharacterized protein LOC110753416 isoform X2 n=1 Tax=Prunus avium TaxID=42229 RepID=A0A6P5RZ30_PRUAV|nr:uncharacterized protein LOC110753416 isoform X2 [Prunus avium]